LQIALDRSGFSAGIIDGNAGLKTTAALAEFKKARGLSGAGLDEATRKALGVNPAGAVVVYAVTMADIDQVGPLPKGWVEKSVAPRLPYPSLDQALAEKFHCSRGLLTRLNPGCNVARLKPGQTLRVPNVAGNGWSAQAGRVDVDLGNKRIRMYDGAGRQIGGFYCSIAASKAKLPPSPTTSVAVVAPRPSYTFDPKKWPEVKGIDQKLLIPPGPRNPVGMCWVGLGLSGYGIHGTPTPEMIGKTGSHGCIRLTNWDAMRLGKMVTVGTAVKFINPPRS
jgi:lipoprotein-anchoring transpeptidase ErfK/SrfK